jgi:hypothetical protein
MRRFLCLFVLCAAAALPASATITLTANLKDLGNGSAWAARIGMQPPPRRSVPTASRRTPRRGNTGRKSQTFYTGEWRRSATPVTPPLDGNDEVTCEALGNSRYDLYLVFDRVAQFHGRYNIKLTDGSSQNLKNLTPITPPPANTTLDYALRNADNTFAAGTKQDLSGAGQTLPMKAGTVPPATCVALKEMFIDTDAAAGARILKCAADGVSWTGMDDSGVASSLAFSGITGGTNSSAAMIVGTGASLATSGSGTIAATTAATATALAGNPLNCSAGNAAAGVDASGVAEGCAPFAQTLANSANKWLNSYNAATGAFTQTQPGFSNLSGSATKAQLPAAAVFTDQANTFGAFLQKFQAGANFDLADPTDGTKLAQFDLSNIGAGDDAHGEHPQRELHDGAIFDGAREPVRVLGVGTGRRRLHAAEFREPERRGDGRADSRQHHHHARRHCNRARLERRRLPRRALRRIGVDASGAAESCTDYMEEPASSGIVARTAANTSAARTFIAGSSKPRVDERRRRGRQSFHRRRRERRALQCRR